MSNLSYATRLSADTLTEQEMFFGLKAGVGFQILITLGTVLVGFTFAGLARSLIVKPKTLVWPGVLANTALNQTLHHKDKGNSQEGRSVKAAASCSLRKLTSAQVPGKSPVMPSSWLSSLLPLSGIGFPISSFQL